jgi:hypothetical protein
MSNVHQVYVNWDFTQETKNKYFSKPISGLGQDLFFSFQDSCGSFFEVCALADTDLYIHEANLNSSLNITRSSKPFIYIKNIGNSDLTLKASNSGQLFSYQQNKLDNVFESLSGDYLIAPQENLIITVNVSTDGSRYFSKSCYPFGFYYDFDNISEINRNGIYPVRLGSSGLPIYTYETYTNLDDSFTICETNPIEQIYCTTYYVSGNFDYRLDSLLGRVECHPETSGKWSLYTYAGGLSVFPNAITSGEISSWPSIYECSNYSGNMFCIFAESGKYKSLIFSGYLKPEKFPDSGNFTSVLSINNINEGKFYTGASGTGYFECLNLDLLRIGHDGYIYIGLANVFDFEYQSGNFFGYVKSECQLVLNQWNDYVITINNCNRVGNQENNFNVAIYGSNIGNNYGTWSCTTPVNDRLMPYQINKNISGICLLENNLEICDIYYLSVSSLSNLNSENFCGLLSDIFLCFKFSDQVGYNFYYDDSATINFDFKNKNFTGRKHSFNFDSLVNECARLSLYASGKVNSINKETKICSLYGSNFYQGNICINSLQLMDENFLLNDVDLSIYDCAFFTSEIKTGCNLCLYYDIDFSCSKYYSYIYCLNAPEFSTEACLVCNFFGISKIYNFESGCILSPNLNYYAIGDQNTCFFVDLNLQSFYSLKTISGLYLKKSSMYLPPVDCIPYCYCFQIADVNSSTPTSISGSWIDSGCDLCIQEYINYTEIVSVEDSNYINCCSQIYEIELNFSESRKKTSDIVCKTENSTGEPFIPIFDISEKTFCYSGLEYRYTPICSILFRCNEYLLPDTCINMQILSSGNSISFDFPIQAVNQDKIKVIAESETIEIIDSSIATLDYGNFFLQFCNASSNYSLIKTPKISSGTISPNFSFDAKSSSKIENNINFYIDPYSNFKDDLTYGMNNFLFFIASELNSGLVYCCNFSGFNYSDSDYNSFMVDLKNEFYDCCYQVPSGSGKFLIDSKISFENLDSNKPLLFKSLSGFGYNFILPIATGLKYIDCTNHCESGIVCNEINITTGLNYLTNQVFYSGGGTGFCYTGNGQLTTGILSGFLSGNNSGFYSGFLSDSSFITSPNHYSINISSNDIDQTISGRSICLIKNYTYSGVQPIILTSNYPLQQIKNNLICRNLSEYSSSNFDCSGLFYYVYDIVNNKVTNLKLISPDLTYFNTVCWSDDRGSSNYLCFLCSDNQYGQLQKNVASIKYIATDLTQNNIFCFSNDSSQIINLNIREDL